MKEQKKKLYLQNKKRFLKKIVGNSQKPRLSVFRSHNHIYAQIINDQSSHTLISYSSLAMKVASSANQIPVYGSTQEIAFSVGQQLAELALIKKIQQVVFDRGSRPYLGRIKALAEGARQQGLKF